MRATIFNVLTKLSSLVWLGLLIHLSAVLAWTQSSIQAVRTTAAVKIDGLLNEDSWNRAAKLDISVQFEPRKGQGGSRADRRIRDV
jgi:hypothetical protein